MLRYALVLLTMAGLSACANIVPPLGGEEDKTPPEVVPERSTPNFQTNFTKQRIELTFNEWVTLEDVFNQVVVSPPLQYRSNVTLKGRTLRFDFDERETLREQVTYTINFGEAVKDLTEKNPAENLRFVFSTGDELDSLSLSGIVVDAQTGEPVEKALFLVYDNLADSVVRTERPFYFARTDKAGSFQIENMRAGTFKGFALKDVDFNYRYNLPNEQIGFPDSLLVVRADSALMLRIRLFEEVRPLRILERETNRYGYIKLTFNREIHDLAISYEDVGQAPQYEYDKDTLHVWYNQSVPQAWALYVQQDTLFYDTIRVPVLSKADWLETAALLQTNRRSGSSAIPLNPDKYILLQFNHPIVAFDTTLIRVYEDTLQKVVMPIITIDSVSARQVRFVYPWAEGPNYQLEALPGAFRDRFGLYNDTIQITYRSEFRKAFGNLKLTIEGLNAAINYVIQLYNGSNLVETFQHQGDAVLVRQFKTLPPGEYSVQIIEDFNKNGRWDTGNYDLRRQPERIFVKKLDSLRANWEVEAKILLEE